MVAMTRGEEGEEMVRPKIKGKVQGIAPQEPNAYSDGSLKKYQRILLATRRGRSVVAEQGGI